MKKIFKIALWVIVTIGITMCVSGRFLIDSTYLFWGGIAIVMIGTIGIVCIDEKNIDGILTILEMFHWFD